MKNRKKAVKIIIRGVVQGIGFRPFIFRIANSLNVKGYVKNVKGGVEVYAEASQKILDSFLNEIMSKKPPLCKIDEIEIKNVSLANFKSFTIEKSGFEDEPEMVIPPDIAICNECVKELRDKENRRFGYFFITCTSCGPRYTIIEDLPFDRKNTTLKCFKLCKECLREYLDPKNRRFHAQTIACGKCGPKLFLKSSGKVLRNNVIKKVAKLLSNEEVVAIKGLGGYHLAVRADSNFAVLNLRKSLRRSQKPFAVMCKDVKTAKTFAVINESERRLLESWQRPIVVLRKSSDYWLSKYVAPGLDTIGVFLPYTALHYLLFDHIDFPIILTSANYPNEPIAKDENEVETFGFVEHILYYNRRIANRCDDSVVRIVANEKVFLRKARGYAPCTMKLIGVDKKILSLGAELNVTFSIYKYGKCITSPHIGDVDNEACLTHLKQTLFKFLRMLKVKPEIVVCDLHPGYLTSSLAEDLASKFKAKLVKVQHHEAHAFSLMAEKGINNIVCIVCDGLGYGNDGNIWGGEVFAIKGKEVIRAGRLEYQPMPGGELTIKYPLRMAAGILFKIFGDDAKRILAKYENKFRYGRKEITAILNQVINKINTPYTSSTGRILDAISALLGVCYERTYEGEPAMKLEAIAKGRDLGFNFNIKKEDNAHVLITSSIIEEVANTINQKNAKDVALSAHLALARGLFEIARRVCKKYDIDKIGFTGGVAYNTIISSELKRLCNEENFELYLQTKYPCGDGGISLGQIYRTLFFKEI